jgi:hypothetical protein
MNQHEHAAESDHIALVDALVARLRSALRRATEDPEDVKAALIAQATGPEGRRARDHIEQVAKAELLEVQWELEDVLTQTAPPPLPAPPAPTPAAAAAPAPEAPEPPPEDPNRPLSAADLTLVYEDPRGLLLHRTKKGDRWFATQVNPATRQPETFELHPQEIAQIKRQLQGSPYWVIGG